MGNVIHLHRPTKINRVSMSAASMVCRDYPNEVQMHKLVWGIVAAKPTSEMNYNMLNTVIEQLKKDIIKRKLIEQANKLDW